MRRLIALGIAATVLAGCSSQERDALAFMKEAYPGVELSIEEAGPVIPLVNPRTRLVTLAASVTGYLKGETPYDEMMDAIRRVEEPLTDPVGYAEERPGECNCEGFRAKVACDGATIDVVFYYGDSGIVNSTLELTERYHELIAPYNDVRTY